MKRVRPEVGVIFFLSFLLVVVLLLIGYMWLEYYRKPPKEPPAKREVPSEEVDLKLAKLLVVEQQASRASMRRLAEGQIKGLTIDEVTKGATKATAKITAHYTDNSTLGGFIDLVHKDGRWYFSAITQESLYPPSTPSTKGLSRPLVKMGKKIVTQQRKNQRAIRDLINGKIKSLAVDNVDLGLDKSMLDITILYTDNSTIKGTAELTYKDGFWYLTKISRKQVQAKRR